jgi:type 1 fimbria pilin
MKAIFKITAAATAVAAALALQLPAVAQTAGTVNVGGQVTPTTCVLLMKNTDGTDRQITTKSIPLGTVRSVSGVDQPMGSFSVLMEPTLPNNDAAWCNQGVFSWNLMLDLNSSQIQTLSNGNTVLKNAIAPGSGGTDAGVALYGGEEGQLHSRLTLKTGSYTLGTKVSVTNNSPNSRIGLTATLVATSASAATAGQFQALVPLVILYN